MHPYYNAYQKKVIKFERPILPYFGKRQQMTNVAFLVEEQNAISTDVNGISCLT